jgi:large-conductance mechanosensitive channel
MQTMLVFIWSIKIEIPYLFVNLVMPFIGIIWFVSDSYGFGKLYLIFNAMSFVNEIVTLITYSSIETTLPNNDDNDILVVKNIICSTINICIIVFMMFLGNRAITQSKKLSLKKEDDNQPLKF